MMKGIFKGFYDGDNYQPAMWVTGYYLKDRHGEYIKTKDTLYKVNGDSVSMHWLDGVFEGDVFVVDEYPFYSDGELNYVGVIEYVPDDGYAGWYYGMQAVSDRVNGCAFGSGCDALEGRVIKVIGSIFDDRTHLNNKSESIWLDRIASRQK